MKGIVTRIVHEKKFGFVESEGFDYFFHMSDLANSWLDLADAFKKRPNVQVEFEPLETPKGLRAANVRLL